MGILRRTETMQWSDMELLPDGSFEQHGTVVPPRLTKLGEQVNHVLRFVKIPELEAK